MKQFIVPTDFSGTAAAAFRYAQQLARAVQAEVTVAHVYHPAYDLSNPYLDVPASDFGDFKQEALDNFIRECLLAGAGFSPLAIRTRLIVGFAGEEIVRAAAGYDLIIMGTTGESGLLEKLFGSVTSFVARNAYYPVLLIPGEAVFRTVRRVMYTSNFRSADEAMLRRAITDSGLSPEVIHFVHAEEKENAGCEVAEIRYEQLTAAGLAGAPAPNLQFVRISCDDVVEGLYLYGQENGIDLIIMGTVHRNFLERLTHRSVTRQMILRTAIPLLIMHFDD